jgi:hypothetical protein
LKKTLGKRFWQGIGAIAGIVALVIAIAQFTKDESPPPAGPSGNVSQGGTGNCNNNGNNNSCSVVAPSPVVENEDSLEIAKPLWPMMPDCDGATMVAAMPQSPDASTLRATPAVDIRTVLTSRNGAAFGTGSATLSIAAKPGTTVQIMSVKPIFYRPQPIEPKWVYNPMGGCGGTYARLIQIDLDKETSVDKGVFDDSGGDGPLPPGVRSEPFGPKFHVTHDDPALLLVEAKSCAGYHEWGISLTYATGGKSFTKIIGTEQDPFRVMGAARTEVPQYTGHQGALEAAGTVRVPTDCR